MPQPKKKLKDIPPPPNMFDGINPRMESDDPLQSPLWPQGGYTGGFVVPVIPPDLFMVKYNDDDENVDGPFDGSTFITDPTTNIAYSRNGDGHPVFVRCVSQEGTSMECIDGDGTPYTMNMIPLPDVDNGALTVADNETNQQEQ